MSKSTQNRILLLSYYYPPMGTIATLRNYIISKQFARFFQSVTVVTVKNVIYPAKDDFSFDHIDKVKVTNFDYRNFRKENEIKFYDRKNPLILFLSKLFDSFPINTFLGEGGIIYILNGYWSAKRVIKEKKITHIYSSFRPFADHWIARLLKRKFPELIWIADYRDIHVDPVRKNVFFPSIQHWYNRRMINKADVVTTVSEGLAESLSAYGKEAYVLRNGIHNLFRNKNIKKDNKFKISYTGSMYSNNRNPSLMLEALKQLILEGRLEKTKIQITYAGKDNEIWKKYISEYQLLDIYKYAGYLSFEDSFKAQKSSNINLLLTYASQLYTGGLTGKLYEYLAAERPILLLISGEKDKELEEMFKSINAGLIVYTDKSYLNTVKEFIFKQYKLWERNGTNMASFNHDVLNQYNWDYMMERFMDYLKRKNQV